MTTLFNLIFWAAVLFGIYKIFKGSRKISGIVLLITLLLIGLSGEILDDPGIESILVVLAFASGLRFFAGPKDNKKQKQNLKNQKLNEN